MKCCKPRMPCFSFHFFLKRTGKGRGWGGKPRVTYSSDSEGSDGLLLDYRKSDKKYNIWASIALSKGSTKLLLDDLSRDAVCFSLERTDEGRIFRATYYRECMHDLGDNSTITFCNNVLGKVSLALMPTPQVIEVSGILPLINLKTGDHLLVPRINVVNYSKSARNFMIRASTTVDGLRVKLLVDSALLPTCDAVCFSLEHTKQGRFFRVTYYRDTRELYFEEVGVGDSGAAPDILDFNEVMPRAYSQHRGMKQIEIELRKLVK